MIFRNPGVTLAQQYDIDTLLFPTWWFNEPPFLSADQYQEAWSITNKVNVLAANIHLPQVGSIGSGIYKGESGAQLYTHESDGRPKLLIADIPISSRTPSKCSNFSKTIAYETLQGFAFEAVEPYHYTNMTMKDVNKTLLTKLSDVIIEECHNGFCCKLNYSMPLSVLPNEKYYFIISNRTREGGYHWCEEFCAIVRCDEDCTKFPVSAETTFKSIEISGNFSTPFIYPNVITKNVQLVGRSEWDFKINKNSAELKIDTNKSFLTFGFYGRCYDRDPPYKQF